MGVDIKDESVCFLSSTDDQVIIGQDDDGDACMPLEVLERF
jgi:hypothetical protein